MTTSKEFMEVQFIQACVPTLEDGDYQFTMSQTVSGVTADPGLPPLIKKVSVVGPRFVLKPTDVNSVFPPKGQLGHYDSSLPHIVLNRKTLPWERTIDGVPPPEPYDPENPNTVPTPWLALLSFSEEDASLLSKPTSITFNQLLDPPSGTFFPSLKLESSEEGTEICQTIEIDTKLFLKVAPQLNELPYLAHARYSDPSAKETSKAVNDGYYSVVVGNRFPLSSAEGMKNSIFLVSLEGYSEYLPGGKSSLDQYSKVRLVVLTSWDYIDQTDPYNFQSLSEKLDIAPLALSSDEVKEEHVKSAYELGYTPLNHINRVGEETVSWYRGPLVPQPVADQLKSTVFPNADAALRYDPETGMFDTSYATAWQLGQLLALQNKGFATTLFQQRVAERRQVSENYNDEILDQSAPTLNAQSPQEGNIKKTVLMLNYLKDSLAASLRSGKIGKGLGDSAGLNKAADKVPGILKKGQVTKAVAEAADPVASLTRELKLSSTKPLNE